MALDCSRVQKKGIVPKPVLDQRCRVCSYKRAQANLDVFDFRYLESESSDQVYQFMIIGENGCHFRKESCTEAPWCDAP